MKDVIRAQVKKNGDFANYKIDIDGDDDDIIGALVCILNTLMDDGKYDVINKALEVSGQEIIVEN